EARRVEGGHWDSLLFVLGELLRVVGPEPEDDIGDFAAIAEGAEVFTAHDGLYLNNVVGTELLGEELFKARGECGFVDGCRGGLVLEDSDDGHAIVWDSGGNGDALRGALDAVDDDLADLFAIGAGGQLHLDLVRDDVALRAAVNLTDGDDGGLLRRHGAAD